MLFLLALDTDVILFWTILVYLPWLISVAFTFAQMLPLFTSIFLDTIDPWQVECNSPGPLVDLRMLLLIDGFLFLSTY